MLIFITGTSSGIGAALSKHYGHEGVTICLLAQNKAAVDAVATECERKGAKAVVYIADVGDTAGMRKISEDILTTKGLPDIVIANAGICPDDPLDYHDADAPLQAMMTNYIGVINTFASFIEPMKQRKSGHLVAISSVSALRATPNSGIYSASKAAVNMWTEALRLKLLPHKVHVATICPGFVYTEMTANLPFYAPGMISADQAARFIAEAIERRKSRMIFPWLAFFIWRSLALMPGCIYDPLILFARKNWPAPKNSG